MSETARPPRILHVHAGFDPGPAELRCARLIDAFADAEHAIVSGDPARREAAATIDRKRKVSWPVFPPLSGKPLPGRLKRLAAAMAGYDLICTYGPGAIDAALAHTLFADVYKLAPLIHHEEAVPENKRNFYRRIALGRSAALVVSSRALERVALETWQQPRTRVRLIPNGIDTRAFAKAPKRDVLPGLMKRPGEFWIGTAADSHGAPGLPAPIRALGTLPEQWQLVVLDHGLDRQAVFAAAEAQGLEDRVHLAGVADLATVIALFDVFMPTPDGPVIEAMAAGLPIVAARSSDASDTVASENGPYLTAPGDEPGLAEALGKLAADPAERKRIGEANRARARAEYDEATMIDRYRALYWGAMGRK